jgi:hypothetical protein
LELSNTQKDKEI